MTETDPSARAIDSVASDPPVSGAVCRVEPQWSHSAFLEAVQPPIAMLNLDDARALLKRGETAATYFPDGTEVIVTSTIADDTLDIIPWESNDYRRGELEIIEEFSPAYYIPMDHSDYSDLSTDERTARVKRCVRGTRWLADRLDSQTELIPLVKGCYLGERCYVYDLLTDLEPELIAYYATRYFSTGGNHIESLVEDLEIISEELVAAEIPAPMLVIGLLSPNYLSRLPGRVVAAAGQHAWRSEVTPRTENELSMQRTFANLASRVGTALGIDEGSHCDQDGPTSNTEQSEQEAATET